MGDQQVMACYSNWMQNVSLNGKWILQKKNYTGSLNPTLMGFLNIESGGGAGLEGVLSAFLPNLLCLNVIIVFGSHILHRPLRFLKQPLIICQLITGILLFSFLRKPSNNNAGEVTMHPENRRVDHVIGSIGVVFNLFIAGVKLDPSTLCRFREKKPLIIGLCSMFVPFAVTFIFALHKYRELGIPDENHSTTLFFILYPLCGTSPIPVYEILDELDLLNSELGRLTLSSTMAQGVFGWMCVVTYIAIKQGRKGIVHSFEALTSYIVAFIFVIFVVRPYALRVVRTTPSHARVRDVHIFMITLGVFAMALLSDICGLYSYVDIPIMMGLAIPNGPPLGTALIERADVATQLFLPQIFMHQGFYIDWGLIKQNLSVILWLGFLVLLTFLTKMVTNTVLALYFKMSLKKGLLLGVIMNFQGLFDVLVFISLANLQLIDKTTFSALILSIMLIMAICSPLVSTYYKPSGINNKTGLQTVERAQSQKELSIMACFFDDKPLPALLEFFESLSFLETGKSTNIYSLHLVDLQATAAASLIYHRNQKGHISTLHMDPVHNHFLTFEQTKGRTGVSVVPVTSVAPLHSMYQDICSLILKRNISFVIVPYPKKNSIADLEATTTMHDLLPMVLEKVSCSLGIMVYHGTTRTVPHSNLEYHVGVFFWGGPDDREAIAIASCMAHHPQVHVTILQFFLSRSATDQNDNENDTYQNLLDAQMITKFLEANEGNNRANISEISVENMDQIILAVHDIDDDKYDLLIVGRRQKCLSGFAEGLGKWAESPELGAIGDLVTSDVSGIANVLIVQQHITV